MGVYLIQIRFRRPRKVVSKLVRESQNLISVEHLLFRFFILQTYRDQDEI